MPSHRPIVRLAIVALVCIGPVNAFSQTRDSLGSNAQSSQTRDAEFQAQAKRPEVRSLGTTVAVLYLMVACKEMDESDIVVLINAELQKLKGVDPKVQTEVVESARSQGKAKATTRACANLRDQTAEIFEMKKAVREARMKATPQPAQTPSSPPSVSPSYAEIYADEIRRQKLSELDQQIRSLYFAIGCGVISEERLAHGLLGTKRALIWPSPGNPLFNLNQQNQYVSGQALFFGIPPEIVDTTYMTARRVGLSEAGANPDALIVRQFSVGAPGPQMAIPMYSGPIGGNCANWREHPENIVTIRQLANQLNLKATSGLMGYQH